MLRAVDRNSVFNTLYNSLSSVYAPIAAISSEEISIPFLSQVFPWCIALVATMSRPTILSFPIGSDSNLLRIAFIESLKVICLSKNDKHFAYNEDSANSSYCMQAPSAAKCGN